jgi:hypothetical protein
VKPIRPILDYAAMGSSLLIDEFLNTATEKGLLIADDAPSEELSNVQAKLDTIQREIMRRMSW